MGNNSGGGHGPWSVTDGVWTVNFGLDGIEGTADDFIEGDLDKTVNGSIKTLWYVDPDDSADEKFLLTALGSGADLVFATGDEELATAFFTDSLETGNRIKSHNVWEIPNTLYTGGNVSGYREGDSASFVIDVSIEKGDQVLINKGDDGQAGTSDDGYLTLNFSIQLDLQGLCSN